MSSDKDPLIQKAKYAESAERYDDMAQFMTTYIRENKGKQTTEVRNLLSVAFKNKIGTRRSSWRILHSEEDNVKDDAQKLEIVRELRRKVEKELQEIHSDIINLIDFFLLIDGEYEDTKTDHETKVFYLKMKGDYCRYKAEHSTGEERDTASKQSNEAYQEAYENADKNLESTNPTRLGLCLNFSVFYYEIQNNPKKACEVAKNAFDIAIASLDAISDDTYKDSTLIMQLLRDNLTLWTTDESTKDDAEDN